MATRTAASDAAAARPAAWHLRLLLQQAPCSTACAGLRALPRRQRRTTASKSGRAADCPRCRRWSKNSNCGRWPFGAGSMRGGGTCTQAQRRRRSKRCHCPNPHGPCAPSSRNAHARGVTIASSRASQGARAPQAAKAPLACTWRPPSPRQHRRHRVFLLGLVPAPVCRSKQRRLTADARTGGGRGARAPSRCLGSPPWRPRAQPHAAPARRPAAGAEDEEPDFVEEEQQAPPPRRTTAGARICVGARNPPSSMGRI
jgi:hypothetical protein